MAQFTYEVRDRRGRPQRGRMEAASVTALAGDLRGRGLLVVAIKPTAAGSDKPRDYNPFNFLPPRSKDVELGFQQLAVMLKSGLSLLTALRTCAEQATRPSMKRVWLDVSERIQNGSTFTDALSRHRSIPRLCVQLVQVGEQTGTLDVVIRRAADVMERRRTLKTGMITALAYPTIVMLAALAVSGYLTFGVIPKIAVFLRGLNRRLPPITQTLLDVTTSLRNNIDTILIAIAAAAAALWLTYRSRPGRMIVDRMTLGAPVIGNIFRLAGTALFARGLGILIASGVTLLDALRTVEQLFNNRYIARRVALAKEKVMKGGTLAESLTDRAAFMPMLPSMVAVGESAGTLEDVLEECATFHEEQLQRTIRWLSVIIEPVIIVVVGTIVGFVYIAFFMALFAAAGGR
jgi:type IV pilus assembly protein PilC